MLVIIVLTSLFYNFNRLCRLFNIGDLLCGIGIDETDICASAFIEVKIQKD